MGLRHPVRGYIYMCKYIEINIARVCGYIYVCKYIEIDIARHQLSKKKTRGRVSCVCHASVFFF